MLNILPFFAICVMNSKKRKLMAVINHLLKYDTIDLNLSPKKTSEYFSHNKNS